MRRLKEGVTCWTVSTLRCQLLPRKFFLQPLLLAKRWGLHFERKSRLPGGVTRELFGFGCGGEKETERERERKKHQRKPVVPI